MRHFVLFVGIIIVALAPCILGQPKDIPVINEANAQQAAAKLLLEFFPNWQIDVRDDPEELPAYERWQHALEEAYYERPTLEHGSRLFRALRSRFTGDTPPVPRLDVLFAVNEASNGLDAYHISSVTHAILQTEQRPEFTDPVAEATADAMMENLGFPVAKSSDSWYPVVDFNEQERTALFAMALFPTSGKMATEED